MLWQGVYSMQQGKTKTWLTNVSGHVLRIQEGTPAHWEPDSSGEIAMADRLYSSARCRAQDTNCKVLALTTSDNGEDWEWADDHLYLDVSQTPVGKPDPPVDASAEQLNTAWKTDASR